MEVANIQPTLTANTFTSNLNNLDLGTVPSLKSDLTTLKEQTDNAITEMLKYPNGSPNFIAYHILQAELDTAYKLVHAAVEQGKHQLPFDASIKLMNLMLNMGTGWPGGASPAADQAFANARDLFLTILEAPPNPPLNHR